MQAKMRSQIARKRLPGGSEIASKWLPEGSQGPAEIIFDGFFLVASWGGLGTSRAAPEPSWAAPGGHFGLRAFTFSSFLDGIFGGWARGLQKSSVLMVSGVFLYAVLVLLFILFALLFVHPLRIMFS